MDITVFSAVLAAAIMHAGWNAVVKTGLDRLSAIVQLALVQSAIALACLPFFPAPAAAAWPWIVLSAFIHTGYKIFLIHAYTHGDLSQVYPLARGTAPVIVAVAGMVIFNEALTLTSSLAVGAIALGVILMSVKGGAGIGAMKPKALTLALCTAACTAAYTIVDGVGARVALTASGFALSMFSLDGLTMLSFGLFMRGRGIVPLLRSAGAGGVVAGALSLGSYWIAIWAFTLAPVALVAALRETSVLFAMLIAVVWLKESPGPWRWAAALLIVFGMLLMRL